MQYRYIAFTDKTITSTRGYKHGRIFLAGKPSAELVAELELEPEKSVHDGSVIGYMTTLQNMGEKGWELQFVTPCGVCFAERGGLAGPIENSYVFRKIE